MLDIKFIRENQKLVEKNNKSRNVTVDLSAFVKLDEEIVLSQKKIDVLRAERNSGSKTKPTLEQIIKMKKVGGEIKELESLLKEKVAILQALLYKLPNLCHESVPIGKDETENKVVRKWGKPKKFGFPVLDHLALGEKRGLIDMETAGVVAGARFTYLKGKLALLQFALINHALAVATNQEILEKIISEKNLTVPATPFIPIIPPVMIRPEVMHKMGRLEPKEERYHIPSDDLYLVGSAEHTMGPMFMDKIFSEKELPLRFVGYSTAFRREAGSYGKDTRGILRVHQFDKIEFEIFGLPEQSLAEQDLIVGLQEYLMQSLELPYQIVLKCTGDMGLPDFREFDVETWIPSQKKYRETHTSDYMTDFQSRRLNTKVKRAAGQNEFVHMNDATVFAIGRTLIAVMENFQQADGSILIPTALQKYTGFDKI